MLENDREKERIKTGKRWIETTLHRRAQEQGLQLENFAWKGLEDDPYLFDHRLCRLSFFVTGSSNRHTEDFIERWVSDCAHDNEVQRAVLDTKLDPLINSLVQKS